MAAPTIVIVWIVAAEASSPTTSALSDAARGAFGRGTEVRVLVEPAAGERSSRSAAGTAVVRVSWDSEAHREAHLDCYVPAHRTWVERDVAFEAGDPDVERGRTLGFLIASIVMGAEPTADRPRSPSSAPDLAVSERPRDAVEAIASSHSDPKTSIGVGAEAAGPGTSTGFGAWVGLERAVLGRSLWIGASARARFGSIPAAQATTRFLAMGAKATWLPLQPSERSRFGLQGGVFVSRLSISHLSDDDVVPDEQARWLPGAELAVHGEVDFSGGAGIFADGGAELLSGSTELSVRHAIVAVWPRAAGLLRMGLTTRF